MSKLKLLNEFFTQRLTVAAVEIFGAVQEVIVEYQDEINRSKEENERLQKLLDLVFKPEIKLHRADPGQITVSVSEEVPHEQQERSPSVRREDIEIKQIKEEQEFNNSDSTYTASYVESDSDDTDEDTISVSEEVHHEQQEWSPRLRKEDIVITQIKEEQEFDTSGLTYPPCSVENYSDGKNPTISLKEDSEGNDLSTTPTEQNKIEPLEEGFGVSVPTSDPQLLSAVNPDLSEAQNKHVYLCLICNKSYKTKGRLTVHMKDHTETEYHCNFCSKRFKEKGKWRMHVNTHTRKRKYGCNVCRKNFKQSNHLIEHMKTHTGEKPYSCHVCDRHFTRRTSMMKHVKAHTEERQYSCPLCVKDFTTNSNLTQHIRVHTGEKPFKCHICGLHFRQFITRTGHIKSEHKGSTCTDEKTAHEEG